MEKERSCLQESLHEKDSALRQLHEELHEQKSISCQQQFRLQERIEDYERKQRDHEECRQALQEQYRVAEDLKCKLNRAKVDLEYTRARFSRYMDALCEELWRRKISIHTMLKEKERALTQAQQKEADAREHNSELQALLGQVQSRVHMLTRERDNHKQKNNWFSRVMTHISGACTAGAAYCFASGLHGQEPLRARMLLGAGCIAGVVGAGWLGFTTAGQNMSCKLQRAAHDKKVFVGGAVASSVACIAAGGWGYRAGRIRKFW